MNSFTFISLTYNQQEYIVEHLESIKQLIEHYGNGRKIDFILADDCSKDQTLEVVKEWIKTKKELFNRVLLLERSQNIGVVRNMLDAVKHVKTSEFKLLAGDDRFRCEDIFSVYDNIDDALIITPVQPFGNVNQKIIENMKKNFYLIRSLKTAPKLSKMIKYENFLPAPGTFIPGNWFRDDAFQKFLLQFRNIEDYPMFYYFLNMKKCEIKILDMCYVDYRRGSGVSTSASEEKKKKFEEEIKKMHELMDIKLYKYPKYINPYKYYFKIARAFAYMKYGKRLQ